MVKRTKIVEQKTSYTQCDLCDPEIESKAFYKCASCGRDLCLKHIGAARSRTLLSGDYGLSSEVIEIYLCEECSNRTVTLREAMKVLIDGFRLTRNRLNAVIKPL